MKQAFSKECKKRGFIKCGKSYMRVVGDGVFQHILPGFKERLHSSAPGYSQNHRYEPRILIYIKSMYARYDDLYVSIDSTTGFSLTIPQLLDKQDAPFMGAVTEMERMLMRGLISSMRLRGSIKSLNIWNHLHIIRMKANRYIPRSCTICIYTAKNSTRRGWLLKQNLLKIILQICVITKGIQNDSVKKCNVFWIVENAIMNSIC